MKWVLQAKDVCKRYSQHSPWVLNQINLAVQAGECFGLVGPSGSGKSTLARVLNALEKPTSGQLWVEQQRVSFEKKTQIKALRRVIQPVFQNPYAAFNPNYTIQKILEEAFYLQPELNSQQKHSQMQHMLGQVHLPLQKLQAYPSQLSGGQLQRLALARALLVKPKLLIADEPLSALDTSTQAEILNLTLKFQQDYGLSVLFISHDLKAVQHICHRVAVLYQGQLVEQQKTESLFSNPQQVITQQLLKAAGF